MDIEAIRKYLKCEIEDCGNRANLIVVGENIICLNCIEKSVGYVITNNIVKINSDKYDK